jgi:putative addiction module component (TIGR02574 family)
MSLTVKEIEKEALTLPLKKRAQLVDKLWDSLGSTTHPILSEEWHTEIERRRREVLEGKVKTIPGEEVSRKARRLARGKNL